MPRRQRHDLRPEILLPDVRQQERQANRAIDDLHLAKVRRRGEHPVTDGWTNIFDRTIEILRSIRCKETSVDLGLALFMMLNCSKAIVAPITDEHNEPVTRDGCIVYRLLSVGCRINMTQEEIAERYAFTRTHVNRQIMLMKKHGLIVNQGRGWYEFDANLCWRGDFKIQKAYREIQTVRDGMIFTDGKTTLVTEDMDADVSEDDGEHPSPRCTGQGGENDD